LGVREFCEDDDGNFGNSLDRMSVISFVLEVPQSRLLTKKSEGVLGVWASVRKLEHRQDDDGPEARHYAGEQTTRLGNPLVNELLIGTTYKNEWNSRHPSGDKRFNEFLLYPVVPSYIQALFNNPTENAATGGATSFVQAPNFPRVDLVQVFHQGITALGNRPPNRGGDHHDDDDGDHHDHHDEDHREVWADLLRINVNTAVYKDPGAQSPLGPLGLDFSGWPNGRRLGDDVVDIVLRAAMGALCTTPFLDALGAQFCGGGQANAANFNSTGASLSYTDQSPICAGQFVIDDEDDDDFPFLDAPVAGNVLFNEAQNLATTYSPWKRAADAYGGTKFPTCQFVYKYPLATAFIDNACAGGQANGCSIADICGK